VAGAHFLLGLKSGNLLVEDLLGVRVGDRVVDLDVEEGIAQRAALVIGDAAREAVGLVQAILLAGARHQFVLDDILQKHLAAISRRVVAEPGPHLGGGKIEIGLLDVDAVDARDHGVGRGRQRNESESGCNEQQG
jgi:hypothetical protein